MAVPQQQVQAMAIRPSDHQLSNRAAHLAEVENTLGAALETMSRPSNLVARLNTELEVRRRRRETLEQEWLDAYRRYNNEYSPNVMARFKAGRSKLWVGLTQMKVHSAHAAIMDFLSDEPWDLDPAPIPDDAELHPFLIQQGITIQHIREEMRVRTESMKTEISNQLDEVDLPENLDLAVLEMTITGSGALKGPFTVKDKKSDWEVGFDANMEVVANEIERQGHKPDVKYCSIFNLYPDMEATSVQDGNGIFEELFLTRAQMMDLAMQSGFNTSSVLRILRDFPAGNANLETHQIELRTIAGDADPNASKRYRVIVYHGPVTGQELSNAGVKMPYELQSLETQGCIWYCGQFVLKAKQHKGRIPYNIIPYVKRAGFGPFGKGVPYLGKGSQDAINAAARIMIDNAAIASGPLLDVNMDLLQPGEKVDDIRAWRVIYSKHDGNNSKRAVNVFEIPAYTDQFIKIIHLFRQLMDEETFMPSLTSGMEGTNTNDTATGMSILNSNANRSLKKVMRNIDAFGLEPLIEAMYDWNMRHNPKREILGKMLVRAKGSAAIMAKEIQTQKMMQFAQMFAGHPDLKSTEAMREIADGMDIKPDTMVVSDEEKAGQVAPDMSGGQQGMPQAPQQAMLPPGGVM